MNVENMEFFGGEDWRGGGRDSMFSAKKVQDICAVGLESKKTVTIIDCIHTLSLGMSKQPSVVRGDGW